jgi:hypothetical protein
MEGARHEQGLCANRQRRWVGLLRRGAPDTVKAFGSLSTAATATKVLDTKTKELMALRSVSRFTAKAALLTIPRWPISTELVVKRLPRLLPSQSTWGAGRSGVRRRCPEGLQSNQWHIGAIRPARYWNLPVRTGAAQCPAPALVPPKLRARSPPVSPMPNGWLCCSIARQPIATPVAFKSGCAAPSCGDGRAEGCGIGRAMTEGGERSVWVPRAPRRGY